MSRKKPDIGDLVVWSDADATIVGRCVRLVPHRNEIGISLGKSMLSVFRPVRQCRVVATTDEEIVACKIAIPAAITTGPTPGTTTTEDMLAEVRRERDEAINDLKQLRMLQIPLVEALDDLQRQVKFLREKHEVLRESMKKLASATACGGKWSLN